MIKQTIKFSAENKYLVLAGVGVALALSFWSMRNTPLMRGTITTTRTIIMSPMRVRRMCI